MRKILPKQIIKNDSIKIPKFSHFIVKVVMEVFVYLFVLFLRVGFLFVCDFVGFFVCLLHDVCFVVAVIVDILLLFVCLFVVIIKKKLGLFFWVILVVFISTSMTNLKILFKRLT